MKRVVNVLGGAAKAITKMQEEKWVEVLQAVAVISGTLATAIASGKFTNKG